MDNNERERLIEALLASRQRFRMLGNHFGFETEVAGVKASAAIADIDAAIGNRRA